MDAAVDLFDAQGYAVTTIDQVAAKAGIAKGSVYNYFENKEQLFQQVVAAALATAEADTAGLFASEAPADAKLATLIDYWHRRLGHHVKIGRLVLEFMLGAARHRGGEMASTLQTAFNMFRQRLAGVVEQGIGEGRFRPAASPAMAAAMIMGLLDGLEVETITGTGVRVDEAFVADLKRAILGSLGVERQ
jgi:AcrR family transcriptional regulator